MGKFKGKAKPAPPTKGVETVKRRAAAPAEFSDDSDAVFSDDDDKHEEEEFEDEPEEIMSPAEEEEDDEEEGGEDDDGENGGPIQWGSKKQDFYKRNSSSEEEDEDDDDMEEEEALRLLKKRRSNIKREDLEFGGGVQDDDDDDDEDDQQIVLRKSQKKKGRGVNDEFEDDADELLATEAPEVLALLGEFSSKAQEIRDSIGPVLERLKEEKEFSTKEGVAYLETKAHLLLSYVINVAFYLMYRAENGTAKAETHPVVNQLVRLRTLLEKLRPLDMKLKNELDELVRRALIEGPIVGKEVEDEREEDEVDDEEQKPQRKAKQDFRNSGSKNSKHGFRPDLKDLMHNNDEVNGFDEEEDEKQQKRRQKQDKRKIDRADKSSLIRELREELSEAPTEVVDEMRMPERQSKYEMEKRQYEEENFTRVRSKKQNDKKDTQKGINSVHGGDLNMLASELEESEYDKIRDLVEGDNDSENGNNKFGAKKKGALSMHLNEMEQARKKTAKFQFGDDDVLPTKRTQRQETQRNQRVDNDDHEQHHHAADQENGDDGEDDHDMQVEEHPFYVEMTKKRKQAAQEKEESYNFPKRFAPAPVRIVEAGGSRSASREMIRNRGLTPHRNKDTKNPRKHLRDKYEAKVKARRGQVRDVRTGEGDYYQGEKSGIRSNVVRSRQAGRI